MLAWFERSAEVTIVLVRYALMFSSVLSSDAVICEVNAEMKASVTSLIGSVLLFGWYLKQLLTDGFYYSIFSYGMLASVTVFGIIVGYLAFLITLIFKLNKEKK